jgi:hypothetical protein
MFTLIAMAVPAVVIAGWKFGAEDRPGFDERKPLN